MAPFTRRGRHVDLTASDRLERRLVFKTIVHAGALRDSLLLENRDANIHRLTRILTLDCGLEATLQTQGTDLPSLLMQIESVAPRDQFRWGGGFVMALSYQLASDASRRILTRAAAILGALTLTMETPTVTGSAAKLQLMPVASARPDSATLDLPEDLLAVLGLSWGRLQRDVSTWSGNLQLRRHEPRRSRDAEEKFEVTVLHLARTLAAPPEAFHDRHRGARWGVFLRRAVPLLACIGLIAAAAAVPRLVLAQDSPVRMLIFNAPPLLLVLYFCMREPPRVEVPPIPRRALAPFWRNGVGVGGPPRSPAPEAPR